MRILSLAFGMMILTAPLAYADMPCPVSGADAIDTLLHEGISANELAKQPIAKNTKDAPEIPEVDGVAPCFEQSLVLLGNGKNEKLMKTMLQVVLSYGTISYADTLAQFWVNHPTALDAPLKTFTAEERATLITHLRNGWMDIRSNYTEELRAERDRQMNTLVNAAP